MHDGSRLLGHAKRMRRAPTDAEALLWRHLRAGRLSGFKFKRQQPLGDFIVDFVCFSERLIVEVDGGQHADLKQEDLARTAWLMSQGFRVVRFWNHEVLRSIEAVLGEVLRQLGQTDE